MDGFDYSRAMTGLCEDIVGRVSDLSHIDMSRVLVAGTRTRGARRYKTYAALTPLRFPGGHLEGYLGRRKFRVARYEYDGREMLYILTFYLPRFQDAAFDFKLETVIHELWHIGPQFDGDYRRFAGRYHQHGTRQDGFDAEVRRLTRVYLAAGPAPQRIAFLKRSFAELVEAHGSVRALRVAQPTMIRVG